MKKTLLLIGLLAAAVVVGVYSLAPTPLAASPAITADKTDNATKSADADKSPAQAASQAASPAAAPPAPGVTYAEVASTDMPERYERLGVVEPSRMAEVRANISGYLSERLFEEGQRVEAGQPLYRIERDSYEATVMMGEAEARDARARLDLAQRELQRTLQLSRTGAVAQERLDQAEIEQERATAAVARAEAALREARVDLSYTEIAAPFPGIVGKAVRDRGDLVDDGTHSMLTTITRISPVYVSYGLSETDYFQLQRDGKLDLAQGVEFLVILKNGETFGEKGTLNYQSPEFEPSTGMLRIRIEFPNKDQVLRPNQFVKIVEDHGVRSNVLTVPKQSVIQSPAGSAVFVIDDANTLEFRPVKVGEWRDEQWEIASGLQAGERVMVEGLLKSRPGAVVNPTPFTPHFAN